MPIVIEVRIIDGCCTGQANNIASVQKVSHFRSKSALMRYFSEVFGHCPINTAFKRVFNENYNKGVRDHSQCDRCGRIYLYGDVGYIEDIDLKKARFDTF